jgi:hypothetical protein
MKHLHRRQPSGDTANSKINISAEKGKSKKVKGKREAVNRES